MNVPADFLVIGSGIAGLRAAITLAEAGDVVILTKADPRESNTGYAQGGIAAALGPDDSPALHAHDTMAAGDGVCVAAAVDLLVHEGRRYVEQLIEWGTAFDRGPGGEPALGREAAHSVRRVLHARDATGREIARVLWDRVKAHPRVRVLDQARTVGLDVRDGACRGAQFVDDSGALHTATASGTLLATGGAGQVYRETTNPPVATGDGIAMAYDAGARITDVEFVQFHPTVLNVAGAPRFLLSEALRGEGARLVNEAGERFVERYEPAGDLASRDLVSRAIVREMTRTSQPVYLTMAHLDGDFIRRRFPTIAETCARAGLDIAVDRIPISPAAHYMMGGVETDLDGRTSIARLFAAGEVACTGVHGANRLASNSLLEGLVFGARAAIGMQAPVRAPALFSTLVDGAAGTQRPRAGAPTVPTVDAIRTLMWEHVGLLRSGEGLQRAVGQLDTWRTAASAARQDCPGDAAGCVATMATVGLLIARAALRREESRGGHFRADYPRRDDTHWERHLSVTAR